MTRKTGSATGMREHRISPTRHMKATVINGSSKIGRWETNGVKEVWHAEIEKGLVVELAFLHCNWEPYYVKEGALEVEVMGEKFIAGPNTLVRIPNFHPHTIRALEHTKLYDYGGETHLMAMLEDLESIKKYQPEKLQDEAAMTAFYHKYKCFATKMYRE